MATLDDVVLIRIEVPQHHHRVAADGVCDKGRRCNKLLANRTDLFHNCVFTWRLFIREDVGFGQARQQHVNSRLVLFCRENVEMRGTIIRRSDVILSEFLQGKRELEGRSDDVYRTPKRHQLQLIAFRCRLRESRDQVLRTREQDTVIVIPRGHKRDQLFQNGINDFRKVPQQLLRDAVDLASSRHVFSCVAVSTVALPSATMTCRATSVRMRA